MEGEDDFWVGVGVVEVEEEEEDDSQVQVDVAVPVLPQKTKIWRKDSAGSAGSREPVGSPGLHMVGVLVALVVSD